MTSLFYSFRATALRALGFDGFFTDSLDDHTDLFAFLLPASFHKSHPTHDLITYLLHLFEVSGWKSNGTKILETATYETNHYRSRHYTHTLGPHILFRMEYVGPQQSQQQLLKPDLPYNWSIVEADYDVLKPTDCRIRFSTFLYEAASPEEYMDVHGRLKQNAITNINDFMNRTG